MAATSHKDVPKRQQESGSASPERKVQERDLARISEGSRAPSVIPEIYKEFELLFREETTAKALPRHQPWDHKIELEPGKEPTFGPIYQLSKTELEVLRGYIDENLKKGFIRESKSSAGYPILFAKKDGSLRLCVDYRKLNDITIKNRYPLPNITEMRDRLSNAIIFTRLDLRGAYNLIRIAAGEEWKTAFRTRFGHYEYMVMPFGLTNAPATCQALINNVIRAHLDRTAIAYLDDILIYSENEKDHERHVKEVLECLRAAGLLLKPEKCEFHKDRVTFLGCVVTTNGIEMDPDKIESIREWPRPTNVKELQALLGFLNYNRQFIPGYSQKALPLTKLTRKDTPYQWGKEQEQAFQQLKECSMKPPVLVTFKEGMPIRIETDASDQAMGACLCQERQGKWHPIAYYSRKMPGAEQNYDIHDKELLAIVEALDHWRVYAESCSELTIFTDHKNLLQFTTTKKLNRRQVRWSEQLGQYKFKILYTPGKDNGRADALSRRQDLMEGKDEIIAPILKQDKDGSLTASHTLYSAFRIYPTEDNLGKSNGNHIEVPEELIQTVIERHHDDPMCGHPGIAKTMELISRNYRFSKMKDEVTAYIRKCISCQKNKSARHPKYGQLQLATVPEAPWDEVTMDFVVKLSKSKDPATDEPYDSIMVIVDKLTKYAIMVPFKETFNAEQLGHVLLDRLIRDHGIPKGITSDRDKLFTSNYWRTLIGAIGTKLRLSTAFHPQTDGQTERTNQTMEAYLRHYVNSSQNNWVTLLPTAQLAYNNARSETTQISPFFANFGKHPNLFMETKHHPKAQQGMLKVEEMKKLHQELGQHIEDNGTRMKSRFDQKTKMAPQLKEGDKVYLLTKNLKSKKKDRKRIKKLSHVKVGPFLIKASKGAVNYELALPPDARVHPVFHISLLEPADPSTPLQETFHFKNQEKDMFEVERILDYQDQLYLVKWKGYPTSENTWEPKEHLEDCQGLLRQYHQGRKGKGPTRRRRRQ